MANHPRRNENRSRDRPSLYAPREREGGRCSPRQSGPADSTIPCHIKETGSQFCCSRRPCYAGLLAQAAHQTLYVSEHLPAPDARRPLARVRPARITGVAMALLLSGAWSAAAHAATPARRQKSRRPGQRPQADRRHAQAHRERADDANLQQLYGTAVDIQAKAAAAETLTPQLASVAARLNELGAPRKAARKRPTSPPSA